MASARCADWTVVSSFVCLLEPLLNGVHYGSRLPVDRKAPECGQQGLTLEHQDEEASASQPSNQADLERVSEPIRKDQGINPRIAYASPYVDRRLRTQEWN